MNSEWSEHKEGSNTQLRDILKTVHHSEEDLGRSGTGSGNSVANTWQSLGSQAE